MAGTNPLYAGERASVHTRLGLLTGMAALWAQPGHKPAACMALSSALSDVGLWS